MEIFASYSGPEFLAFYAVMLVTCIFAGIWIPANLRPVGWRGEVEDMEEAAVLSGGIVRHAMAVSSDLFARGGLAEPNRGKFQVLHSGIESGSAGQALLRKSGEFNLRDLKAAIAGHASRTEARLVRRGLLMDTGDSVKLRILSVLPYIGLFAIGLYRQQAGSALGEPTNVLIGLLFATFLIGTVRFAKANHRTIAGNAVLRELEGNASRLSRAPKADEAGLAVALFGTAALVGTPWAPISEAQRKEDDSSGCGGGCGGGVFGGGDSGGCGGCGG